MKLKSTGQTVYNIPWSATATKPWDEGYSRVLIPNADPLRKPHIQIVRNDNLK